LLSADDVMSKLLSTDNLRRYKSVRDDCSLLSAKTH
jgi:hypothetical protein